jgi:hypothetical protein
MRHRLVKSDQRPCRKAGRNFARGHTGPSQAGNPGKCCERVRGTGNARRSGGSPNPRL